jgi:Na+/H+-dicarboxylate symporter
MSENVGKKKGILSWYFEANLLMRIFAGLVLGIIVGLAAGESILWMKPFGDLFVNLLKMIMLPLIVSSMIVGACSVNPAQLGKVGVRVLIYYLMCSAVAVAIGLAMGVVFQPQADITHFAGKEVVRAAEAPALSAILLSIVPTSVAKAIVNETILGVIFFSLMFGICISFCKDSGDERIKKAGDAVALFFEGFSEAMMVMIRGIMQYAPIGVLALVAVVFAQNGPKVVGSLAVVTLACYVGYALMVCFLLFILMGLVGRLPLKPFVLEARKPFLTGFVTRSSNGSLPVNMEAAKRLGVPRDVYSFALPLGATINMDGTAVYQGVCATFIAWTVWGHGLSPEQMGIVVVTGTLASIGTAGIPGAGAIMLLLVLESLGLPVEAGSTTALAYAMILGIDAILDMGRTAINVVDDLICSSVVSKQMKLLDESQWTVKESYN